MKILSPKNVANFRFCLALVAAAGFAAAALETHAQSATGENTYDWSAEMVSFDDSMNSLTVKARVEEYAEIDGLDEFSEGDRLTLVWTGRSWAAGVRDLARNPDVPEGTLTLPVEFAGSEMDGRYIRFRVPVPAGSIERVSELQPGDRVTGISPRGESDWASGVVSLRHYNDIS